MRSGIVIYEFINNDLSDIIDIPLKNGPALPLA